MASRTPAAATLLAVALATFAATALAQDEGPDSSTIFQDKLTRLLDRWNDEAALTDRLQTAIDLCERRVKAQPDDAQAHIELARFRLAKGDRDSAVEASLRAEVAAASQPERLKVAQALHLVAYSIASTAKAQSQEQADAYQKKFVELYNKLTTGAGGKEQADALIAAERDRLAYASTLTELGKQKTLDVTFSDGKIVERKDTEGKLVKLDAFLGKVVIVDFWSADYEPYQKEIANTLAVYAKYKDKLEVVGISLDKDRAALDAFVKANAVPWRQIYSGKGLADDTVVAWGVPGVRRYVIDQDGKVRFVNVRGDGLAAAVEQLVKRAERPSRGR